MNKKLRILLATVLVLALAMGIGLVTFSEGSDPIVTLNGSSFVFSNVADPLNPDLFKDMKNVMPGDTIEQPIVVRATGIGSSRTAEITLKVVPVSAGPVETVYEEVPSTDYDKLMNSGFVSLEVYNGTTLLSESNLATGVILAKLGNNENTELTVKLVIDKQADNEIAGLTGEVDWVFTATVTGGGGDDRTRIPETGVPGGTPELEKVDHNAYIIGRDDGLIHPMSNITRAEMATIFFRMLTDESRAEHWAQSNAYDDVSISQWYNNAVSTLTNGGVLEGRNDGRFDPNAPITRAEFAAMLSRFYEAQYEGNDQFSDIAGHWAQQDINKAYMNNLLEGYPDGTFRPDNYITRAEAITGMNNILGRAPDMGYFVDGMITWTDNSDTSVWYYEAVQEATNSHDYEFVMSASGTIYEKWSALREARDWAELETEWAKLYGEDVTVISSK